MSNGKTGKHMGSCESLKTLIPVMGTHGCLGHVLATAKGHKAYDADDKPLGTFPDQSAAVQAVLTLGQP